MGDRKSSDLVSRGLTLSTLFWRLLQIFSVLCVLYSTITLVQIALKQSSKITVEFVGVDADGVAVHTDARRLDVSPIDNSDAGLISTINLAPHGCQIPAYCDEVLLASSIHGVDLDTHAKTKLARSTHAPKRLRSRCLHASDGMCWRATWEYCKSAPACLLDARQTNARTSTFFGIGAVRADVPAASSSVTVGRGEVFHVGIQARDETGAVRTCGGDSFQIELRGPSLYVGHATDNLNGTYSFYAVLYDVGTYEIQARLDYRACEGMTHCLENTTKTIAIEWIGEQPPIGSDTIDMRTHRTTLTVVEPASPCAPDDCLQQLTGRNGAVSVAAQCRSALHYRCDTPAPDDPIYRRGRWKTVEAACASQYSPHSLSVFHGQSKESTLTAKEDSSPGSAGVSDGASAAMRDRCTRDSSSLRTNGLVWVPIDSGRALLPLECLRNKWVHSIGDSISWYLVDSLIHLLRRHSRDVEAICYYTRVDALMGTHTPFLVRDHSCRINGTAEIINGYRRFLSVAIIKELNFTVTRHWALRRCVGCAPTHPVHFTSFAPWTSTAFLAQLDSPRSTQLPPPYQSSQSPPVSVYPVPPSPLHEGSLGIGRTRRDAIEQPKLPRQENTVVKGSFGLRRSQPQTSTQGATYTNETRVRRHGRREQKQHLQRRRRESSQLHHLDPDDRVHSPEFLFPLRPGLLPTHVVVNSGLHHMSHSDHLDIAYGPYVTAMLREVIASFPPNGTHIIWRSTAQTQWPDRRLPFQHKCRTPYRITYANEVAAKAIASLRDEFGHQVPVSILDYFQVSLGRPDSAPDNRHYNDDVQIVVIDELLHLLCRCAMAPSDMGHMGLKSPPRQCTHDDLA